MISSGDIWENNEYIYGLVNSVVIVLLFELLKILLKLLSPLDSLLYDIFFAFFEKIIIKQYHIYFYTFSPSLSSSSKFSKSFLFIS